MSAYCKAKGIPLNDILKNEFMETVMRKYRFPGLDSILAAIGHGGLKEGQVVNKLMEGYEKKKKKELTDEKLVESVVEHAQDIEHRSSKNHSAIVVKGLHDLQCVIPNAVLRCLEMRSSFRYQRKRCFHPPTDCINIINLSAEERARLIDAECRRQNPRIQ